MKLFACAGVALWAVSAAAVTTPDCSPACAPEQVCRLTVNADGLTCGTTTECVARVGKGKQCDGAAAACFVDTCAAAFKCRQQVVAGADVGGLCTTFCPFEGSHVFEGWTGPAPEPANWCHRRTCGADGTIAYEVAEADRPVCATALELRCCKGEAPEDSACCGETGAWVKKQGENFVCAGVSRTTGDAAPFTTSCNDATRRCAADKPELWTGYSTEAGQWCNTCVCKATTLSCTMNTCLTAAEARCCPKADKVDGSVCCGASGLWVTKDTATMKYACGGITRDAAGELPFAEECADMRKCVVTVAGATVEVEHGKSTHHRGADLWCNTCNCADGTLTCGSAPCTAAADLKCCPTSKGDPAEVCCGVDGLWKAADGTCGGVKAEFAPAAPFTAICPLCLKDATPPVVGAPVVDTAEGWTGLKVGGKWCETCSCAAAAGAAPVMTCESVTACPALRCCVGTAPSGTVCCGTTATWVPATGGKAECAGRLRDVGSAPFDAKCGECDLKDGRKVPVMWAGRNNGDQWCASCHCQAAGDLQCTSSGAPCPLTCCVAADEPAGGAARCCGASGKWVLPTGGEYRCGGVSVATGLPLHTGMCVVVLPAPTCAGAALDTVRQGADGTGANWCKDCKCTKMSPTTADWVCPPGDCAAMRCCKATTMPVGARCCGALATWVMPAGGDVTCAGITRTTAVVDAAVLAPFGEVCDSCTADTVKMDIGMARPVPGNDWCSITKCTAADTLVVQQTKTCPALKCCQPPNPGAKCCGATGMWASPDAVTGKFSCHGMDITDGSLKPLHDLECAACDFGSGFGTKPPGWLGMVNCNRCYCRPGMPPQALCSPIPCPTCFFSGNLQGTGAPIGKQPNLWTGVRENFLGAGSLENCRCEMDAGRLSSVCTPKL